MSVKTEEKPSRIEQFQNAVQFMRRFRAAGFHDALYDVFMNTESSVLFEELAASARGLMRYRYATIKLDSYEPRKVFGIAIGYSEPRSALAPGGHMLIDLVQKGVRGAPFKVGREWSPIKTGIEAKIVSQDTTDRWGRGAHTITIRVRTPRPAPSR